MGGNSITWVQILSLLGVPSLCATLVLCVLRKIKSYNGENAALRLGVQALLRAQMINDYNKWTEKGFAPIYARENFENCWVQYEALGANGVMTDIHNKFMALSTEEPKKIQEDG